MITIPKSVEVIGQECFDQCLSLHEIRFEGSIPKLGKDVFGQSGLECIKVARDVVVDESLSKRYRIEYL
jgi:hypothetical protein